MASIASGGGPPESPSGSEPHEPDDARTVEEIVAGARRPPRVTPPALRRVPYRVRRPSRDRPLDPGADVDGGVELDVVGLAVLSDRVVEEVDVAPPPPPADPLRRWLRRTDATEVRPAPRAPGGNLAEES